MWTKPPGAKPAKHLEYLARDKLAWLLLVQTLLILPLLMNLPLWLWAIWALIGLWRVQMFRGRWVAPGGMMRALLMFCCCIGLLATYAGKTSTDTMVGLLVCAFVLKLLEVNSARDVQLLVFIGFVICACQLLFNQSPLAALYSLVCIATLLACWRALHLAQAQSLKQGLLAGGRLLLHSLPIMLVMFVVLPRLGPLWAVPNQQAAQTGFSDTLAPGDLGKLALNPAPAFRVEFAQREVPPPAQQLYWRGLVLDKFDGRAWRQRELWAQAVDSSNSGARAEELVDYSIILEPHGQPWLFSLMTPQRVSAVSNRRPIRITNHHLLFNPTPVAQRLRYEVNSALSLSYPSAPQLSAGERASNTQLPNDGNAKTRALAQQWRREGLSDEAIIERALAWFSREFTYSLQPPLLGQDPVDDFLFTTRKGFCEHFASSFSLLLRAAEISARVVVGYQGGRWNPVENYLLVRQSDAHAWTEVWIEGEGWRTIDPTAAVAPNRIEMGLDNALSPEEQALVSNRWQNSSLLYDLQLRWDAATFVWQRWVLNYDNEAQQGLLTRLLGGTEVWRLTLWLLGMGLVGAALAAWLMLRSHRRPNLRPEVRAIQQLERKLAGAGYRRASGETLRDFLTRVSAQKPHWQVKLTRIALLFEQVAYQTQAQQLSLLQAQIRRFPAD